LLEKISWDPDSSAVAKQAVETAASVKKSLLEKEQEAAAKAAEEAKTKAAEARTKLETALATAKANLETLQLELAVKQAELAFLLEQPPSEENDAKVVATRMAIVVLEVKIDKAVQDVAEAQAALNAGAEEAQASVAANEATVDTITAPGPVFYAIKETAGTAPALELITAEIDRGKPQKRFETVKIEAVKPPVSLKLTTGGGIRPVLPRTTTAEYQSAVHSKRYAAKTLETLTKSRAPGKEIRKAEVSLELAKERLAILDEGARRFEITSSLPLVSMGSLDSNEDPCRLAVQPPADARPRCRLESSTVVVVEVPDSLPTGIHKLEINVVYQKGKDHDDGHDEIEFEQR
jgi:hypothetical protein